MNGGKISGNSAASNWLGIGGCGGGIYYDGGGDEKLLITGGEISGNSADLGGGVYLDDGDSKFTGGEIHDNTADAGGGVFAACTAEAPWIIDNTKIFKNKARKAGGGVALGGRFLWLQEMYFDYKCIYENTNGDVARRNAFSGYEVIFRNDPLSRIEGVNWIHYEANGGEIKEETPAYYTVIQKKSQIIKLPTMVVKEGCSFAGWYRNENFSGSAVTEIGLNSTGAKNFYAKWEEVSDTLTGPEFTVYKNLERAEGAPMTTVPDANAVQFSWSTPAQEGTKLLVTDANGKCVKKENVSAGKTEDVLDIHTVQDGLYKAELEYANGQRSGACTFKVRGIYSITFELSGGKALDKLPGEYVSGRGIVLPGGDSVYKEGCVFNGWLLQGTKKQADKDNYLAEIGEDGSGDLTLTADWGRTMEIADAEEFYASIDRAKKENITMVMTGNISLTKAVTIYEGETLILDLNGHDIFGEVPAVWAPYGFGMSPTLDSLKSKKSPLFTVKEKGGILIKSSRSFGRLYIKDSVEGAIRIEKDGSAVLESGTISGCKKAAEALVVVEGSFAMMGGEITGNTFDGDGAGVRIDEGMFIMTGGKITGNTASGLGGGVFVDAEEEGTGIYFIGGEISGNKADKGGGICIDDGFSAILGGKVADNTALKGGGIYVSLTADEPVIGGAEVTGNKASVCGGIYANANVHWQNYAGKYEGSDVYGTSHDNENGNIFFGNGAAKLPAVIITVIVAVIVTAVLMPYIVKALRAVKEAILNQLSEMTDERYEEEISMIKDGFAGAMQSNSDNGEQFAQAIFDAHDRGASLDFQIENVFVPADGLEKLNPIDEFVNLEDGIDDMFTGAMDITFAPKNDVITLEEFANSDPDMMQKIREFKLDDADGFIGKISDQPFDEPNAF